MEPIGSWPQLELPGTAEQTVVSAAAAVIAANDDWLASLRQCHR